MRIKTISMKALNHIKELQMHIYYEEDEMFPDQRRIVPAERAIERTLDREGIIDGQDRDEIRSLIQWSNDDNVSVLNKHGWTVTRYEENNLRG